MIAVLLALPALAQGIDLESDVARLQVRCQALEASLLAVTARVDRLEETVAFHDALAAARIPPEQMDAMRAAMTRAREGVQRAVHATEPPPEPAPAPPPPVQR